MAVTSGFYNSLNGDRKYNSEQFSALFDSLIIDGVFANIGTAFAVTVTSDTTLTVGVGRAWFNSTWLYNDTLLPMTPMDAEILLNRIDAIVIEINHNQSVRNGQIRWVYGNPANEPQRPTITNTDEVHQYPLAYVYRKAGVNKMTQADVTNMIGSSSCPYVSGILSTQNIDNVVAQWQTQFNLFMDGLEESLSGDVASNLTSQVLELQERFRDLASDQAVYEPLQDSSGNVIKDSYNGDVLAATSLGGGDGTVIVNYPNNDKEPSIEDTGKVGDIIETSRTDLGDDWALCNGAVLNRTSYPALSDTFPPNPDGPWSSKTIASSTQFYGIGKVVKNGSYLVGIPVDTVQTGSANEANPFVYISTNSGSTWTKKVISTSTTLGYWNICNIVFVNNYFIVMGDRNTSSDQYNTSYAATIWYATNPSGTWTLKQIASGGSRAIDILWADSKYYCLMEKDSGGIGKPVVIAYATNLSSWALYSATNISCGTYEMPRRLVKYGSQYVIMTDTYRTPGSNSNLYYASSISATSWTEASAVRARFVNIEVLDGKLLLLGYSISGGGNALDVKIPSIWFYNETLTSVREVSGRIDFKSSQWGASMTSIAYDGEYYFAVGYYVPAGGGSGIYNGRAIMAYAKDIESDWTYVRDYTPSTFDILTEEFDSIRRARTPHVFSDEAGSFFVSTIHCNGANRTFNSALRVNSTTQMKLPLISPNAGVHSYIKIK